MASYTRPTKLRVDSDGVRIEVSGVRGRVWLLLAAMALVVVALVALVRPARRDSADESAVAQTRTSSAPSAAPGRANRPASQLLRAPVAVSGRAALPGPAARERVEAAPAEPAPPTSADAPTEEAPMFATGAPGEGIAVFPPPGTKPIKRGILVPENFELPPGYVRHYQATDDGQRVPAILMFHPDYHPVDEHGVPVPLPADRVVPPDMAPPGMPVEMLEVPEQQGEAPEDVANPAEQPSTK
jgi:hypothetical protein